jgi:FPC/CPF motif-containing protein YcgG
LTPEEAPARAGAHGVPSTNRTANLHAALQTPQAPASKCPITRLRRAISSLVERISFMPRTLSKSRQTVLPEWQESLYDSKTALIYSCYTGLAKADSSITRTEAPLFIIPEGKLHPDRSDEHPEPVIQFFHDQFRALAMHKMFPCIGARTSMHHGQYRFGLYPALGSMEAVAGNGRDLRRFVSEHTRLGDFTSFIAVFQGPAITSEDEYEALLWKHLQLLHDHDELVWDPDYAYDPNHPEFSFSFAKRSFFVVGLNPLASRISRNYIYPAIAFNPELQIARLRNRGELEKWEHDIREADIRLQGSMNPSITTELGKRVPEARVYSGKANPPDAEWKCPFRMRPDVKDPKAKT